MTEKETYWSRFAEDFQERNDYVVGKDEVALFLRKIAEQKNLGQTLELGCGVGTYSQVVAKEAELLYATDLSDEMLTAAREKLQSFPNVRLEKVDCFHLPYENNSFDTVFIANLLHIIPEPEKAIAEASRVLKNNGRLIALSFTTEGMTFLNKLSMSYRYLRTYGKPPESGRKLTVEDVRMMMGSLSMNVITAQLIGNNVKAVFVVARK